MLLRVEKIKKIYGNSANSTKALNNITFSVKSLYFYFLRNFTTNFIIF